MMYRLSISVFSEDPRAVASFVEELKRVLSQECTCVDFAYANAVCQCGSSLVSLSVPAPAEMRIARAALHHQLVGRQMEIEIVVTSPEASGVIRVAELVRDVAKSSGVGIRARC